MKKKISQSRKNLKQKNLTFKEQQQVYSILQGLEGLQKFVNSLPDLKVGTKNITMQKEKIRKERIINKYKSMQQSNKPQSTQNSSSKNLMTEILKPKIGKQINVEKRLKRLE